MTCHSSSDHSGVTPRVRALHSKMYLPISSSISLRNDWRLLYILKVGSPISEAAARFTSPPPPNQCSGMVLPPSTWLRNRRALWLVSADCSSGAMGFSSI
ncbi:hypothetical protein D3C72_2069050 [compost metagenome]